MGKGANACGPGIRNSGLLCRSLRDLTTSVSTSLMISDSVQQRTLGVLMTLEPGVSPDRLMRYATAIKKQSCPQLVRLRNHVFRELCEIERLCAYCACDRAPVLIDNYDGHQDDCSRLEKFCSGRASFCPHRKRKTSQSHRWENGPNRFAKLFMHSPRLAGHHSCNCELPPMLPLRTVVTVRSAPRPCQLTDSDILSAREMKRRTSSRQIGA